MFLSQQSTTSSGSGLGAPASSVGAAPKQEGESSAIKTEPTQIATSTDIGGGEIAESTSGTSAPGNVSQSSAKDSRSSGEGNSSALHWLADLATQKAKDDTKGNLDRRKKNPVLLNGDKNHNHQC